MPRPTWKGTIQFGLVSVPIGLFPAVQEKPLRFHWVHDADGARIHEKRICSKDGKEVSYDHIARGYEVAKGEYVVFRPEELQRLADPKNGACEIESFVDLSQIDPVYFGATYYAVPDKGATKSYRLLVEAMRNTGKVGIGRIVLRTRESPVAMRANGRGLAFFLLHHDDEVRDQNELEGMTDAQRPTFTARELKMAEQLVGQLAANFEPSRFRDHYRERVRALVRDKEKNGKIASAEIPPSPEKTVDLMEALRRSLAARRRAQPTKIRRARHRG